MAPRSHRCPVSIRRPRWGRDACLRSKDARARGPDPRVPGDAAQARELADKLNAEWPLDTLVQNYWISCRPAQRPAAVHRELV